MLGNFSLLKKCKKLQFVINDKFPNKKIYKYLFKFSSSKYEKDKNKFLSS